MTQVLDYSLARPDPAAIVAAGYIGVLRYLAPAMDAPKVITQSEYDALRAAGLQVALNWEWYGWRAREGAASGTADAQAALAQADALGYTGAIYFSVDYDAPPEDQPNINDYFSACAAVIGLARLGAYGGYWPLSRLFDAGLISFGWQAVSWSGGNRESRAHLFQTGATALGGDINDVLKANWVGGNMLPDGWTDDTNSGVLTAPNGVPVKDDFRLLILNESGWRRENVPAGPDYPANPLTISDPTIGAGQRQDFEYCSLGWTASIAHAFFLGTTKEIALLKAQPAPTPPPVPEPVVPAIQSYTVAANDSSIQQIATKLNLGSWFSELYQPNMDEIETAARAAGHPNSDYGATVVAGTVLRYRA